MKIHATIRFMMVMRRMETLQSSVVILTNGALVMSCGSMTIDYSAAIIRSRIGIVCYPIFYAIVSDDGFWLGNCQSTLALHGGVLRSRLGISSSASSHASRRLPEDGDVKVWKRISILERRSGNLEFCR
jgi:hypothetical protein